MDDAKTAGNQAPVLYKRLSLPHHERMRIATGIFVFLMLAFPATATMAAEAEEKPACTPVIRLFGRDICREIVDRGKIGGAENAGGGEEDPRDKVRRVREIVWRLALIEKFGDAAVIPVDAEVEAFRAGFRAAMDRSYESDKKTVDAIRDSLGKYDYGEENQKKIDAILKAAEASVRFYEQREEQEKQLPEAYRFVSRAAETQIALDMLAGWKANKLLYDAYGGRLVYGQDSIEPVDAYAAFLDYIRKEAKVEIVDPAYDGLFTDLETWLKQDHRAIPPDDPLALNYFTAPEWQFTLSNSDGRLEELKSWLEEEKAGGRK